MTGTEFESWIKRLGLKKGEVAVALGIGADTVTTCCKADQVKPLYAFALLGLAAQHGINELRDLCSMVAQSDNRQLSEK